MLFSYRFIVVLRITKPHVSKFIQYSTIKYFIVSKDENKRILYTVLKENLQQKLGKIIHVFY